MRRFHSLVTCLGTLVLIFVLAAALSSSGRPVSAAPTDDTATQEASAKYQTTGKINQIRRTMGLSALAQEPLLDVACENHSKYMEAAGKVSFEEHPEEAGFTGGYPTDRASYAEYNGRYIMEYDNYRMVSYEQFADWCIQDPYLRTSLLNPYYEAIGYAKSGYYYCMMLGGDSSRAASKAMTTVYPYAGQTDVSYISISSLSYVPQKLVEMDPTAIGVPVTIQYYAEDLGTIRFENISAQILNTETEEPLDIVAVRPQDKNGIWNTLIIFPTSLYRASTRYTVTVSFDVFADEDLVDRISEKWSFTSIGSDYTGGVKAGTVVEAMMMALRAPQYRINQQLSEMEDQESYATREQTIAWMIDLLTECAPEVMETVTPDYKETYEDINECDEKTRDKVQMAYQMRLIEDQGRGILNPKAPITQAELNKILSKLSLRFQVRWEEEEQQQQPPITPPDRPGHRTEREDEKLIEGE